MSTPVQLIVMGPSGVGKTTLQDRLLKTGDFRRGITVTTRPRRPSEEQDAYDFLTPEAFERLKWCGEMAEETVYISNPIKYGILWSRINEAREAALPTIWALDTVGAARMRELFPGRTLVLFLAADLDTLTQRMRGRGETEETIARRLTHLDDELAMAKNACDITVDTRHKSPEEVEAEVRQIIATWKTTN